MTYEPTTLITTEETRTYLDCSIQTIRNYKRLGHITPVRAVGNAHWYKFEEIDEFRKSLLSVSVALWREGITAYFAGGRVVTTQHVTRGYYMLQVEMTDGRLEWHRDVYRNVMLTLGSQDRE